MKIILWIFYRFLSDSSKTLSYRNAKPYGFLMDYSRTHRGRCLIDMTTRSPIDMIRFPLRLI